MPVWCHGVQSQAGISSKTLICPGDLRAGQAREKCAEKLSLSRQKFTFSTFYCRCVSGCTSTVTGIIIAASSFPGRSVHYQFLCLGPIKVSFFCQLLPITEVLDKLIRDVLGLQLKMHPFLSVCSPGYHCGSYYEVHE